MGVTELKLQKLKLLVNSAGLLCTPGNVRVFCPSPLRPCLCYSRVSRNPLYCLEVPWQCLLETKRTWKTGQIQCWCLLFDRFAVSRGLPGNAGFMFLWLLESACVTQCHQRGGWLVNHTACRPSGNAIAVAAHLSSVFPSIRWSGHKVRMAQQGNPSHMWNMTAVLLADVW